FTPAALGLGDVSREGKYVQALAAIYDLEGFTDFSNQVDSHLVLPEFLRRYLDWFFSTVRNEHREGTVGDRVKVWGSLPFFVKFLGDGLLLLWDTQYSGGMNGVRSIVLRAHNLTTKYQSEFLPEVSQH